MSITLGGKVKILRKAQSWSQQELADRVDVHVTHISRIESDQYTPSLELLKRLARTFQVTTDYLLYDQDDSEIAVNKLDTVPVSPNRATTQVPPIVNTITTVNTAVSKVEAQKKEAQKVEWQDNALYEKMKLLDKLDEEDRKVIHSVIDAFLTKQQIWELVNKSKFK